MTDNFDSLADDTVIGGNWDNYEPPKDFNQPPDTGEYTFMRATEGEYAFQAEKKITEKTNTPYIQFNIQGQIQGGDFSGRTVFLRFNTLTNDFKPTSDAAHFLRANGSTARPNTSKEWKEAVERCIGPFKAVLRWEWYCGDCGETFLKGQRNPKAPKNYSGGAVTVKKINGATAVEQTCALNHGPFAAKAVLHQFVVPKATTATRPAVAAQTLPPAAG